MTAAKLERSTPRQHEAFIRPWHTRRSNKSTIKTKISLSLGSLKAVHTTVSRRDGYAAKYFNLRRSQRMGCE